MKTKTTVNLETKDLRKILALFLNVREEQIIPNRYSFGVEGLSAEAISAKITQAEGKPREGGNG